MNKLQALVFLFAQQSQELIEVEAETQPSESQPKLIQFSKVKTATQSHTDSPKQRIQTNLKQLATQAEKINQLSAELEEAMGKLKAIATQVNQDSRFFRLKQRNVKRFEICEYRSVNLPVIRQKSGGCLVLTSRSVDLSKEKFTTNDKPDS
ncbi:MAG: hypothetical protein ACRDEA_03415 [Microcystaceae cyanobacterium]